MVFEMMGWTGGNKSTQSATSRWGKAEILVCRSETLCETLIKLRSVNESEKSWVVRRCNYTRTITIL